jgi:hypothetical protein
MAIPEAAPSRESVHLGQIGQPNNTPAISESRSTEPPLAFPSPTNIRLFVPVNDHVSTALRPINTDGLDWLKSTGYRTVLCLRQPGENDDIDRPAIERRNLKFISLEVAPQNLRDALDKFNSIVKDSGNYPLFVYSSSSMISGTMWYLHFRTAGQMDDKTARAKAVSIGLQEEQNDSNRPMWLAIQKTLEPVR